VSATGRSDVRDPLDFYMTPTWATLALLDRTPWALESKVLEPGCGNGGILTVLVDKGISTYTGIEIDPRRVGLCHMQGLEHVIEGDYLNPESYWGQYDLAIGNPPYKLAFPFVQRALKDAKLVAMLLRLNWMASIGRREFHAGNPAHILVLDKRPGFREDGKTDATEYGWFVWGDDQPGRWEVLNTAKFR
jgi:predicted RNA methylase